MNSRRPGRHGHSRLCFGWLKRYQNMANVALRRGVADPWHVGLRTADFRSNQNNVLAAEIANLCGNRLCRMIV
jgi:hypothetical protein